jgi:cell division protease FtsH
MSRLLGPTYYEHEVEHPFLGQRIATDRGASDATTRAIEQEARVMLESALKGASEILTNHRDALDRLGRALLEKETIEADDLKALFGEPKPGNELRGVAIAAAAALKN